MRNVRRLVVLLAGLAVVAIGVVTTQRSVSYVTTQGSSMQPGIHEGDLAVVRAVPRYEPGDVVAYRSDHLDTVVMHRIVERDGDRYVLKGDNNTWLDSDRPSDEELLGRLWLRVPKGGRALAWVAARWPLLAVGAGLSVLVGVKVPGRRGRHRRRKPARAPHVSRQPPALRIHRRAQVSRTAGLASVCLATFSAILALVALSQSTHRPTTTEITYTQLGAFEYSALTEAGAAYPDGTVATGDPVFRRLVSSVEVAFVYELDTDAAASLNGEIALHARVSDSTGWQRTIPLAPAISVRGPDGVASGTLDLDRIQSLIDDLAKTTGIRSGAHTVELIADVEVTGRLAEKPLNETLSAALSFHLDPLQLRPTWEGVGDVDAAALETSSAGAVSVPDRGANRLTVLGMSVDIAILRWVAGAAAVGAAVLLLAAIACRIRRTDESMTIASRYGDRIVEVAPNVQRDRPVIDLATMSELARLAAHHDTLILHEMDGDPAENRYLFHHDRTVYRYTAASSSPGTDPPRRESVSGGRKPRSRSIRHFERSDRTPFADGRTTPPKASSATALPVSPKWTSPNAAPSRASSTPSSPHSAHAITAIEI